MRNGRRRWLLATALLLASATAGLPADPGLPAGDPPQSAAATAERPTETAGGTPPTALTDALDQEIARAADHLQDLERFAAGLSAADDDRRGLVEAAHTRVAELAGRLHIFERGASGVSEVYDEIVA